MEELRKTLSTYLGLCRQIGTEKELIMVDLRHIAFWYEYYATTLKSVAESQKPVLAKGTYKKINEQAQLDYMEYSCEELMEKIESAQQLVESHVSRIDRSEMIPYKQGSRKYQRDEYVDTIATHLDMHIRYLEKER